MPSAAPGTVTIPARLLQDEGRYIVSATVMLIVNGSSELVGEPSATFEVTYAAPGTGVQIGGPARGRPGKPATFHLTGTEPGGSYMVQWLFSGADSPGRTVFGGLDASGTVTIPARLVQDEGRYIVGAVVTRMVNGSRELAGEPRMPFEVTSAETTTPSEQPLVAGGWKLVEIIPDPAKKSRTTSNFPGGIETWTMGVGSFAYEFKGYRNVAEFKAETPTRQRDRFSLTYDPPPCVINPGESFQLKIRGSFLPDPRVYLTGNTLGVSARYQGPNIQVAEMTVGKWDDKDIGDYRNSVRWTVDVGFLRGSVNGKVRHIMEAEGVYRLAATTDLPDEFTITQNVDQVADTASGHMTVAIFRYCRNGVCQAK